MPRRGLRRVRPPVERLDPHPLHQRGDAASPHLPAFSVQQALQHPAACEGILEMQLVDPAHECEIDVRRRTRAIVHAAPADPERLRLPGDAQLVVWLGCTLYCCARSARIRSPFTASRATRALNAAL